MPPPPPASASKAKGSRASGSAGGIGTGSGAGAGAGSPASRPNSGLTLAESIGVADKAEQLSPAEQKRRELLSKMSPSIAAVIERLKDKNSKPSADEAKFVSAGKAEIQVWLADKSPETLAQLKQLSFEIVLDPKTAKMIIGRLPIDKLAALAELKVVRYIAPIATK